jgi:hypothetical protein
MKQILTSIFLSSSLLLLAQKAKVGDNVGSFIETNTCDNTSKTISNVTSSGKSLLIVASGYDCSICKNEAPGIVAFANDNKDLIEVWGAMHNRFSANTPTCTALESWKTNYNWSPIFMFNDVNRVAPKYWAQDYTYYTVIGTDNLVAYYGNNGTTARAKVKELSRVTGVDSNEELSQYFTFYQNTLNLNAGLYIAHIELEGKLILTKIIVE